MASYHNSSFVLLLLSCLICFISFVQSYDNGGVTIDMIHRDSPLSPSHDPSKTRFERLRTASHRSFSRKSSLLLKSSKIEAPITAGGGSYLIEYKIGTPPVRQLSNADTGSDLTWIQCQPCTKSKCYNQNYPLFDPASSKSYRPVSCLSDTCHADDESTTCNDKQICTYETSYGDGSYSQGELAKETLTLGTKPYKKFVFGCGHNNGGTFTEVESGIFGLGNGAHSFIKQQKSPKFSYCLTSLDSTVPSKISFGKNADVTGPDVLSTPLVSKEDDTFYYLILNAISVGTERFEYKSSTTINQQQPEASQGNIIIDSGTTLTFVPSEMYDSIEASLRDSINASRIEQQGDFSLCYESPGGAAKFSSPPVTAHFEGADVVLPQKNIFLEVEKGVVCLSLVRSEDLAIFGNLHQVDYLIGYDLVKKTVNFLKTDCAKSH